MIELRALTEADVEAHNAGEDAETIRWLTGESGTHESTTRHIRMLAAHAADRRGKQGFGVWLDGRLAGYVDCDPEVDDGLDPGDVNISYAVHPWAHRRGVATAAVGLILGVIKDLGLGTRAAIRADPDNVASNRVAERAGFRMLREVRSTTDRRPDGSPARLRVLVREL